MKKEECPFQYFPLSLKKLQVVLTLCWHAKWGSLAEHGTVTELPQSCSAVMVTGDRVGQSMEFHCVLYCIAVALVKYSYQFQPNELTTFPSNHSCSFTGQGTLWNGPTSVSQGTQKSSFFLLSSLFWVLKSLIVDSLLGPWDRQREPCCSRRSAPWWPSRQMAGRRALE